MSDGARPPTPGRNPDDSNGGGDGRGRSAGGWTARLFGRALPSRRRSARTVAAGAGQPMTTEDVDGIQAGTVLLRSGTTLLPVGPETDLDRVDDPTGPDDRLPPAAPRHPPDRRGSEPTGMVTGVPAFPSVAPPASDRPEQVRHRPITVPPGAVG